MIAKLILGMCYLGLLVLCSILPSRAFAIAEGEVMPTVSIKAADSKSIVDWSGKVTVLNFWATWCDACKVELKEMSEDFASLYKREDVVIRFVSLDKDVEKARAYLEETFGKEGSVTSRIAFDSSFEAAEKLGVDSFPMTIVLDKQGKVVKIQRGFKPGEGSTAAIAKVAASL